MRLRSTTLRRLPVLLALILAPMFAVHSASVSERTSANVASLALALNWQVVGFPAINLYDGFRPLLSEDIAPVPGPLGFVGLKLPARVQPSALASEAGEIPGRMFLDQNFPNPFHPSTMIRYGTPGNSRVRLTVHTLIGSRIRVLVDQWQEAGVYTYDLTANDLPSGAYFYRLQTDYGTITRRMIVAR